jgi:hypothetical protein
MSPGPDGTALEAAPAGSSLEMKGVQHEFGVAAVQHLLSRDECWNRKLKEKL